MQFKYKPDSDIVLITIDEPALNDAQTKDLADKVAYFVKTGKPNFIVDLKDIKYLDSRTVGSFVMCRIKAVKERGDFILANVPEQVMNLMGIAHLLPVFTIVESIDEGMQKLKGKKDKAD